MNKLFRNGVIFILTLAIFFNGYNREIANGAYAPPVVQEIIDVTIPGMLNNSVPITKGTYQTFTAQNTGRLTRIMAQIGSYPGIPSDVVDIPIIMNIRLGTDPAGPILCSSQIDNIYMNTFYFNDAYIVRDKQYLIEIINNSSYQLTWFYSENDSYPGGFAYSDNQKMDWDFAFTSYVEPGSQNETCDFLFNTSEGFGSTVITEGTGQPFRASYSGLLTRVKLLLAADHGTSGFENSTVKINIRKGDGLSGEIVGSSLPLTIANGSVQWYEFPLNNINLTLGEFYTIEAVISGGPVKWSHSSIPWCGAYIAAMKSDLTFAFSSYVIPDNEVPDLKLAPYYAEPTQNMGKTTRGDGQSFTAGISGILSRVKLYLSANATGDSNNRVFVYIREGVGLDGPVLGSSGVVSIGSLNWYDFKLGNIRLIEGHQYTIQVINDSETLINWEAYVTNSYDAGKAYYNNQEMEWDYLCKSEVVPADITLTVNSDFNGSTNPSGLIPVKSNESQNISATPTRKGYHFVNWTSEGSGTVIFGNANSVNTTVTVTAGDVIIRANFAGILGDVNGDDSVTINDALLVARVASGMEAPANFNWDLADVNKDGSVNIIDALLITRFAAGIIKEF